MAFENYLPRLRFPEFTDSWNVKKLGEEISFLNGFAFSSNDSTKEGVVWVKIADVGIERMEGANKSFLPMKFKSKYKKFLLYEGDYVIALTRPILNGKLKIARIDAQYNESLLNQRVGKIITSHNLEFIYNLLSRTSTVKLIENNIAGTDPPNLSTNSIADILIYIPSPKEQKRIADFLSVINERIQQLEEQRGLLEKYKKGCLRQIFNQQLRFTAKGGKAFPDWEEKKLGKSYESIPTNSYSREDLNYDSGEIKNIHYGDIHTKFSTLFDIKKEKVPFLNSEIISIKNFENGLCKEGDLVLADASEDTADVGKCIELIKLNNEKVVAGLHTILLRPNLDEISSGFGGYLLSSPEIKIQIARIAQGSKVYSISSRRLLDLKVKLPRPEEQKKIVGFLSSIDEQITLIKQQIELALRFKKGLLQQMFV
jgi:type I restriction enzyme S subunit